MSPLRRRIYKPRHGVLIVFSVWWVMECVQNWGLHNRELSTNCPPKQNHFNHIEVQDEQWEIKCNKYLDEKGKGVRTRGRSRERWSSPGVSVIYDSGRKCPKAELLKITMTYYFMTNLWVEWAQLDGSSSLPPHPLWLKSCTRLHSSGDQ